MNISWKTCFRVALSIFALFLSINYWPQLSELLSLLFGAVYPVLFGLVLAYILNILMRFYERYFFPKTKRKGLISARRPICLFLAIVTLLAIIVFIINMIVPELVSCLQTLLQSLPPLIESILDSDFLEKHLPAGLYEWIYTYDWYGMLNKAYEGLKSQAGAAIQGILGVVTSAFSKTVSFFLSFIFTIYFLLSKETLVIQFNRLLGAYMKDSSKKKFEHVLSVFNISFSKFIVGQCLEAIILGSLCAIGMFIFRFPYAIMIGTLVGFTALVPIAGAFIGAGVGVIMIATISFPKALLFLLFFVVLQQLEGNLIYPKVVGSSINLPAIWVLAAITVFGGLYGIVGMLVGVPLTAAVYTLIKENVRKREAQESSSIKDKV